MDDPPSVDGWDVIRNDNDSVRYDHETRTASVTVWPVKTLSGDAYNCRLFVAEEPYTRKSAETSMIARSKAQIPDVLAQLEKLL